MKYVLTANELLGHNIVIYTILSRIKTEASSPIRVQAFILCNLIMMYALRQQKDRQGYHACKQSSGKKPDPPCANPQWTAFSEAGAGKQNKIRLQQKYEKLFEASPACCFVTHSGRLVPRLKRNVLSMNTSS